ncbi:hypothetical protein EYC84_002713 [Monilinia fructicola]|uniref:Uncharacterized protein n=1 Tax=Monilinia fructicola TaxID=38448 RepID=A0A5M9JNZ8_MONFR|nr:hypothetical protein EYC84_002713 [Monilinia fructicola]
MMNGSAWLADGGLHTFEGRRRIFPGELKGVKISLNRLLQKVNYDMRERERYELMGFKLIGGRIARQVNGRWADV